MMTVIQVIAFLMMVIHLIAVIAIHLVINGDYLVRRAE
jgi:hypothetical protein